MDVEHLLVFIIIAIAGIPWVFALFNSELRFGFPKRKDYLNASRENYKLFISSVDVAKKSIIATFGEADYRLYIPVRDHDTPDERPGVLYNKFEDALKRKVKIEVFCGPEIVVPDKYEEDLQTPSELTKEKLCEMNGLLQLVIDGCKIDNEGNYKKVILYCSRKRENNHFRLIDKKHVYLEKYHEPLTATESCWEIQNSVFFARKLKREVRRLRRNCDECGNEKEILKCFKIVTETQMMDSLKNAQGGRC